MSSYTISLPSTPVHVACSSTEDALAAVLSNGEIQVYDLNTRLPDAQSGSKLRGGGKIAEPKLRWEEKVKIPGSWCAKQVVMGPHDHVGVLLWAENDGNGECRVAIARPDAEITLYPVESTSERLLWSDDAGWVVIDGSGSLQTGEFSDLTPIVWLITMQSKGAPTSRHYKWPFAPRPYQSQSPPSRRLYSLSR